MIEISHQQAQRLISRQVDLLLSDDEWSALQNHLEHCPTCRIYQDRLQWTERKISQCLRARWDSVAGPSRRLPQTVSKIYAERDEDDQRSNQTAAAFYAAVFSLILLLAALQIHSSGIQQVIPITAETGNSLTPTAAPTKPPPTIPLIKPGQFPHIIAYQSNIEGNAEIYLLNPGFSPVNLTQHPAEDTFPAWSPDGEWLAFLSNRAAPNQENGKNELYLISIGGNRLVQLTSESRVNWDGPLSWSADGKWIALAGVRQGERSIYVAGVNGSGLRRLPNTQGGQIPKFAPYGDRLAFRQTEGSLDRIVIYHVDSGRAAFENIPQSSHSQAAIDVAFDWPADGDGLYYTASLPSTRSTQPALAPACSRMVIQQMPNDEAWHQKLRDHFHRAGSEIAGTVRSVSWAPEARVIYAVDLQVQDSNLTRCEAGANCAGLLDSFPSPVSGAKSGANAANFITEVCVQSGLDRGAWSLDMHWLIFTAYEQGLEDAGLYAVRMPGLNLDWQLSGTEGVQSAAIPAGTVFRLSPGSVQSALPRMRPFRAWMKIEPQPGPVETMREDARSITR